jgi:hypothetical protein
VGRDPITFAASTRSTLQSDRYGLRSALVIGRALLTAPDTGRSPSCRMGLARCDTECQQPPRRRTERVNDPRTLGSLRLFPASAFARAKLRRRRIVKAVRCSRWVVSYGGAAVASSREVSD